MTTKSYERRQWEARHRAGTCGMVFYDCRSRSKAAYEVMEGSPDKGGEPRDEMVPKLITYLREWKPGRQ